MERGGVEHRGVGQVGVHLDKLPLRHHPRPDDVTRVAGRGRGEARHHAGRHVTQDRVLERRHLPAQYRLLGHHTFTHSFRSTSK